MPEEIILSMSEAAGEAASVNESKRPRSADGSKNKSDAAAVINVD